MLADTKARRMTEVFAQDFSRARFASFEGATDEDRAALNESVVATFQDHFWTRGGSIADLFTTTRFVVNPTVAKILGRSMSGTGLQTMDVAGSPQRVGFLSHPGMIAGMGDRAVGSFVNRGKYLMERLLCRNPAAVPDALAAESRASTRTRAASTSTSVRRSARCAPCAGAATSSSSRSRSASPASTARDATSAKPTRPASRCRSTARCPPARPLSRRTRTCRATCRRWHTAPSCRRA